MTELPSDTTLVPPDAPHKALGYGKLNPYARGPLIRKAALSITLAVVAAAAAGWWLREPLEAWGRWFVETLGPLGLVISVLLTDCSPLPLTNEPLMMLALRGGMSAWEVFALTATASSAAGIVGYLFGRLLANTSAPARLRNWNPLLADWIARRGAWAVAIAAVSPLPYSLATWSCGMMRVPITHVGLAVLARLPKTGFYLMLILLGFDLVT